MDLKSENSRRLAIAVCAYVLLCAVGEGRRLVRKAIASDYFSQSHAPLFTWAALHDIYGLLSRVLVPLAFTAVYLFVTWALVRVLMHWKTGEYRLASFVSPQILALIGWLIIAFSLVGLLESATSMLSQVQSVHYMRLHPWPGSHTMQYYPGELIATWIIGIVECAIGVIIGLILVAGSREAQNPLIAETPPADLQRRSIGLPADGEVPMALQPDTSRNLTIAVCVFAIISGIGECIQVFLAAGSFIQRINERFPTFGGESMPLVQLSWAVVSLAIAVIYFYVAWLLVRAIRRWKLGEPHIPTPFSPQAVMTAGWILVGFSAICAYSVLRTAPLLGLEFSQSLPMGRQYSVFDAILQAVVFSLIPFIVQAGRPAVGAAIGVILVLAGRREQGAATGELSADAGEAPPTDS